jgi:hypothetical protein
VSQAGNQQKAGIKQSRLLHVCVLLGLLFDPEVEGVMLFRNVFLFSTDYNL